MSCALITHSDCRRHEMGEGHPECPERLDAISDFLAGLRFVKSDYRWITRELVALAERHCEGRIVSSLEGGYNLFHLARSAAEHVRELAGAG